MLGSLSKRLEDLSLVQRERLAYIDFRLYFFGEIGRPDLIERFGVAPAGATRDLALYREIAPHNITFDGSNKIYRIGQGVLTVVRARIAARSVGAVSRFWRWRERLNAGAATMRIPRSPKHSQDGCVSHDLPRHPR